VGCAVHKTQRAAAWLTGLLCLLLWHAVSFSLRLGQVDAWVLLSLATTIFALSRKQWAWAGVALSFAVILKISPSVVVAVLCNQKTVASACGGDWVSPLHCFWR
jgi:ABC-type uncharacterized transport system permease subunit